MSDVVSPSDSPWTVRSRAGRRLGNIRRVISDQAVDGVLPTEEQVKAYGHLVAEFESAHAQWALGRDSERSRAASAAAGVAEVARSGRHA